MLHIRSASFALAAFVQEAAEPMEEDAVGEEPAEAEAAAQKPAAEEGPADKAAAEEPAAAGAGDTMPDSSVTASIVWRTK